MRERCPTYNLIRLRGFRWLGNGTLSTWKTGTVPPGAPMRCLCGATYPRGPDGEKERLLWLTCQQCWDETCMIVGLRPCR